MKKTAYLLLAIIFLASSCKKIDITNLSQDQGNKEVKTKIKSQKDIIANLVEPPCQKNDLISLGNGVYQYPSYGGVTIRVSNIWYKTTDDYGSPLPVRDGDPIYGTIEVGISSGSEFVEVQPNSVPQNHFGIKVGVITGGNGTIDFNSYTSDYNTAYNNYTTAYTAWQVAYAIAIMTSGPLPTSPQQFSSPSISNYITLTINAGWKTITGKLIRSTTGSTFAIACEEYPLPPPPPPPPPCPSCEL